MSFTNLIFNLWMGKLSILLFVLIILNFAKGTSQPFSMELKPVDITPKAQEEILKIMDQKNIPEGYKLRIGMEDKTISCGATNFTLAFDKESKNDLSYIDHDVAVVIKKTNAIHLAGLTLDYVTKDETSGFSFSRKS